MMKANKAPETKVSRGIRRIPALVAVVAVATLILPPSVFAQAPPPLTVNIQGAVRDAMGDPLSGTREYLVRFFDASVAGTQLGSDITGSTFLTDTGVFNIELILPAAVLTVPSPWYELAVDTDVPPDGVDGADLFGERVKVNSVPFALLAANSDQLGGLDAADYATDAELATRAVIGHVHSASEVVSGEFPDSRVSDQLTLSGATVSGSTIDGTTIGANLPAAGWFTNLSADGDVLVGGKIMAATVCAASSSYKFFYASLAILEDASATGDLWVGGKISAATICAASASIDTASFVTDVTIGGTLYVDGSITSSGGVVGITDADTLDGLDSLQFLRSDVDDTFEGNKLTVDGELDVGIDGLSAFDVNVYGASPGSRIFWDASKSAFRVGNVTGTLSDDANIGEYSIAMGELVAATGRNSVAIGYQTVALGPNSVGIGNTVGAFNGGRAFGTAVIADGSGSTAIGYGSISQGTFVTALGVGAYAEGTGVLVASPVLGYATGYFVTTVGPRTYTGGFYSQSFGTAVYNYGLANTAVGTAIYSYGYANTTIGALSYSYGTGNTNLGPGTYTSGSGNLAVGAYTYAGPAYSTTVGNYSITEGTGSTSVGNYNYTYADASSTFGHVNYATATHTVTVGNHNGNYSYYGIALGNLNDVTGDFSAAVGGGNDVFGYSSMAFGLGNVTFGDYSAAIGNSNEAWSYNSVAVGVQNEAEAPYSAAFGYDSDAEGYAAASFGVETDADGDFSVAVGYETDTILGATRSVAVGVDTTVSGNYATAVGVNNNATGTGSLALGYSTITEGDFSIAIGHGTTANGYGSMAFGFGITTDGEGSLGVALGDQTGTVVATDDTMAVVGGKVVIGSVTPSARLHVEDDVAGFVVSVTNDGDSDDRDGIVVQAGADDGSGQTDYLLALDGDGDIVGALRNDAGVFSAVDLSDLRSKTDIHDTTIDALEVVNQLRVVDFKRVSMPDGKTHHGFIAQEAQEVFPYMVTEIGDGLLGISKDSLIPVLTKAIQQQQQLLDRKEADYEARLEALSQQIEALNLKLEALSAQSE